MFLGIDIGTQSVKALLYDAERRRVAGVQSCPLELLADDSGSREQLAGWWLTALGRCLAALPASERALVQAVGVSGQQHGFVPLAESGDVLAPVKLWCDTATTIECEEITAAFGGERRCIDEVGNPILPGYTASKVRWLKKNEPDAYAKLATILLPHDYINFYLTGERAMEYGDASGTGLMEIRNRAWHPGMLAAVDDERDLAACLPGWVEPDAAVGTLRAEAAAEFGLPANIPVAAGGGDNMMAAIGTGNVEAGRITVSLGTSGTLFSYADAPVVDGEGAFAAFCSSTGGWLPLVCTMNCTVATELTRNLFGLKVADIDRRVATVPAGAEGVVTLPFFNGERTPNLPAARGCLFGLHEGNYSSDNLLRSAMESAVFGLRSGLEAIVAQGCAMDQVRLTGGGAASAVWRQMVADVFNLPVSVQQVDEGAALGAALQALWMTRRRAGEDLALRDVVDEHLALDEARGCVPDGAVAACYAEHYAHYLRHVGAAQALYS